MSDIIHLLPDSVANQIAAGEVVQRPASAVKELMENSIDAGAENIKLIIREAGKTLIQVIDNGKGMSETDARMAFERHATSKIRSAEDIFAIFTKGFRGEALASIAAVAQVELKSRMHDQELGTCIKIEGSRVQSQEFCNTSKGTKIEVKNLFYNIPARRNFLKSNNIELRHIIDEFERLAIAHPNLHFSFINNNSELFDLPPAGLRQRIVNVFGKKYNEKLVPVDESTPLLKLNGFICKPEFAKKTRGEQFFFANNRYIRNNYLHKAVCNAFEGLLTEGNHPSYFLFLELDPARIDVNIHPTKTEIKFDDERAIHTIIRTAVKHALGQYNISPSLDFETDQQFNIPGPGRGAAISAPGVMVDTSFNPFNDRRKGSVGSALHRPAERASNQDWESLMNDLPEIETTSGQSEIGLNEDATKKSFTQIGKKYILTNHRNGMIMIHQQRAHERIRYESLMRSLENKNIPSQQLLFPQNISFSTADMELMKEMMPRLREMGFDVDEFSSNELIVNGIPLSLEASATKEVFEKLIEDEKDYKNRDEMDNLEFIAKTMAKVSAIKIGKKLEQEEMHRLVDELFACTSPYISLAGKAVMVNLKLEDIDKSFN